MKWILPVLASVVSAIATPFIIYTSNAAHPIKVAHTQSTQPTLEQTAMNVQSTPLQQQMDTLPSSIPDSFEDTLPNNDSPLPFNLDTTKQELLATIEGARSCPSVNCLMMYRHFMCETFRAIPSEIIRDRVFLNGYLPRDPRDAWIQDMIFGCGGYSRDIDTLESLIETSF